MALGDVHFIGREDRKPYSSEEYSRCLTPGESRVMAIVMGDRLVQVFTEQVAIALNSWQSLSPDR